VQLIFGSGMSNCCSVSVYNAVTVCGYILLNNKYRRISVEDSCDWITNKNLVGLCQGWYCGLCTV